MNKLPGKWRSVCVRGAALAAAGAVLLSGSIVARGQSSGVNALPPIPAGSPRYLEETWRSALQAPMPFGATPSVIPPTLPAKLHG